jgi:hypothetical protein
MDSREMNRPTSRMLTWYVHRTCPASDAVLNESDRISGQQSLTGHSLVSMKSQSPFAERQFQPPPSAAVGCRGREGITPPPYPRSGRAGLPHPAPLLTRSLPVRAQGPKDLVLAVLSTPNSFPWIIGFECRPCFLEVARVHRPPLPSSGSLGPHFATFVGTVGDSDCCAIVSMLFGYPRVPIPYGRSLVLRARAPRTARCRGSAL